jgi:hypothetical protein
MPRKVKAGEKVQLLKDVEHEAFWADPAKHGWTTIRLAKASVLVAVTDELGGNVMVEARTPRGEPVYVPLAQGEFVPAKG